MRTDGENTVCRVESIKDREGKEQQSAPHPGQEIRVVLSEFPTEYDVIRRRETISKTQLTIILAFERVREIWK